MKTLRLAVRPSRSADIGAFVPVEAEPAQIPQNARLRLDRRALDVGVLDAENERAAAAAREQPVEERGTHAADVQMTGGARSEAYAHPGRPLQRSEKRDRVRGNSLDAAEHVASVTPHAFDADVLR